MATTQESMKEDDEQFGTAFDEDTPAPVEQTEDEAFGLNLPATDGATEGDGETDGGEVVTEAGTEAPAPAAEEATTPTEELPVEPPAEEVAAAEAEMENSSPDDSIEKKRQKIRSWEGRLRALKAEIGEVDDEPAPVVTETSEANEEAVEAIEEAVESGEMSPEEAMRQLEEDFGPSFVKMIVAIAGKSAAEVADGKVGEIGSQLASVIDDIKDSRSRRHFKEIYRVHPDFADVANSDEFKTWISAMAPEDASEAQRVVDAGDSDEINDLLSRFKGGKGATAEDESQIDDAEGVRSTGLRLPDAPAAGKDDFEDAWNEHA